MGLVETPFVSARRGWSVHSIADPSGEVRHETLPCRPVVLAHRHAVCGPHLSAAEPRLVVPEARLGEQRQDLELSATGSLEDDRHLCVLTKLRPQKRGDDEEDGHLRVVEVVGDLRVPVLTGTDQLVAPQLDLIAELELPEKRQELRVEERSVRVRVRHEHQLVVGCAHRHGSRPALVR